MSELLMFLNPDNDVPRYDFPEGFSLRNFQLGIDEQTWADIEVSVGEFTDRESALEKFRSWSSEFSGEIENRCFFLTDDSTGKDIGTITSWKGVGEFYGYGRIHWVAIVPEYQGKELSKPLLSHALSALREEGFNKIYLKTDDTKQAAINLYNHFGFTQSQPETA